ncbi:MAG: hypothetical protein KC410_18860 [Anaerolineales bacterium]|uniref:hypothetical protein n=1 Tax=Promineifilum sp. TaxID=2664178 RepID=UPI001DDCD33C|nr:hypothetical protein [Anaerolineales bacterium]MCB8934813.1 hypothetical protein [Promineifilum sp.]MCO5181287.1 hypothetical protein [Promineifilum sp.]
MKSDKARDRAREREDDEEPRVSTLKELMRDKPRRGRPRRQVARQNVYVALHPEQKTQLDMLAGLLPAALGRADLPDLAVSVLTARVEALRTAVTGRTREIPEGVTDLESLYLLWDVTLPNREPADKWTSIRLSPQQVLELGRVHGTLNAAFGANRSEVFGLALALLAQFLERHPLAEAEMGLSDVREMIFRN